MSAEPSRSILQRVAAGDSHAVKDCLDQYGGLVWSLARRFCRGNADAEDAVQEIFIAVWKSAGRYDPARGTEATFVATIARRRLIDRLRAAGARPDPVPVEDASQVPSPSGPARLDAALDVKRVQAVLSELRPEQREVLELAVVSGYSHSQIASRTGLALGTVKTHVRRGLIRIREALQPAAAAEEAR